MDHTTGDMELEWPCSCMINYATPPAFPASCKNHRIVRKGLCFAKDSQNDRKCRQVWKNPWKSGTHTPAAIRNNSLCPFKPAPSACDNALQAQSKGKIQPACEQPGFWRNMQKEMKAQLVREDALSTCKQSRVCVLFDI